MNVLIVDDEPMVLSGIRRALFKTGWKINVADSGQKALQMLSMAPYDFVVSDMRMPGMDGAQLLEKVSELYPSTVRIMLSGYSDLEAAKRATFVAHQWIAKPCDPETLRNILDRICQIRNALPNDEIKSVVGHIKSLPTPPKIFMRIKALLKEEDSEMRSVAALIEEDPSLTAKILQISNSSFFVHGNPATTLEAAITRLGIDVVCSIVLLAESFSQIDENCGFSVEQEQMNSLATARLASSLVPQDKKDETLLGGLLHDIGKMMLYKLSPDSMQDYCHKRTSGAANLELEKKLFGADHTQLAGYLLHLWNFPYSLIDDVASHHSPERLLSDSFTPGAAIYVADQLISGSEVDEKFIEHFDLKDKIVKWRDRARNLKPGL